LKGVINISDINTSVFSGRLAADPEFSDNGSTPFCKFSIAVNRYAGGEERTAFVPIKVFGNDAVRCKEYLHKGRLIVVKTHLETNKFTTTEGKTKTAFDFVAEQVSFGPKV